MTKGENCDKLTCGDSQRGPTGTLHINGKRPSAPSAVESDRGDLRARSPHWKACAKASEYSLCGALTKSCPVWVFRVG